MIVNYYITVTFLDMIHRPVFYLKHDVSDTGICPRPQMESTQLRPIDDILSLRTVWTCFFWKPREE
jgi:hypothetical protein